MELNKTKMNFLTKKEIIYIYTYIYFLLKKIILYKMLLKLQHPLPPFFIVNLLSFLLYYLTLYIIYFTYKIMKYYYFRP